MVGLVEQEADIARDRPDHRTKDEAGLDGEGHQHDQQDPPLDLDHALRAGLAHRLMDRNDVLEPGQERPAREIGEDLQVLAILRIGQPCRSNLARGDPLARGQKAGHQAVDFRVAVVDLVKAPLGNGSLGVGKRGQSHMGLSKLVHRRDERFAGDLLAAVQVIGQPPDALRKHPLASAHVDDRGRPFVRLECFGQDEMRHDAEQRDETKGNDITKRHPPRRNFRHAQSPRESNRLQDMP